MDRLINVLDLEATCWDGPIPEGQSNEVIEIGVCIFGADRLERLSRHQIVVRPHRSEVSELCTRPTGWSQEHVALGTLFAAACERLRHDFHSDSRPMVSWGGSDSRQMRRQCGATNTPVPSPP